MAVPDEKVRASCEPCQSRAWRETRKTYLEEATGRNDGRGGRSGKTKDDRWGRQGGTL